MLAIQQRPADRKTSADAEASPEFFFLCRPIRVGEAETGTTVYVTGLLPHYVSLNPLVLAVIKDIWQLPSRALDTKGEAPVSLTEHHLASGVEQRSTT